MKPNRSPRHRGVVLFTVLCIASVCLLVLAGALRSLVIEHQQVRMRHEQRQCRRLAESAIERARAMLTTDDSYDGETWTLAAADLKTNDDAAVETHLDGSRITATAKLPATGIPRIQHTETQPVTPSLQGAL